MKNKTHYIKQAKGIKLDVFIVGVLLVIAGTTSVNPQLILGLGVLILLYWFWKTMQEENMEYFKDTLEKISKEEFERNKKK